jgi:hypothetical protein
MALPRQLGSAEISSVSLPTYGLSYFDGGKSGKEKAVLEAFPYQMSASHIVLMATTKAEQRAPSLLLGTVQRCRRGIAFSLWNVAKN